MLARFLFVCLVFMAPFVSKGQYLDFLKAKHEWPADLRVPLEIKEEFIDNDAVILYENLQVIQNFKKVHFQELIIEKHKLIFVRSSDLVKNEMPIVLPESEDELADLAHIPFVERGTEVTPELLDVELHYYAVRIHKSDGRVVEIRPVFTFDQIKVRRGERLVNQFVYRFKHQGLEVGDILEIHYKYELPYQKNIRWLNSFRILQEDNYPRQIFDVSFRYESGLDHTIRGARPVNIDTNDSKVTLRWKFRDIKPFPERGMDIRSLNEPIELGLNTYADWMYNRRSLPGFRDRIPWYMSALQSDYPNVNWLYRIAKKRIYLDKQSRLVRKYLDRTIAGIPDSMPGLRGLKIHEDIRANFEWRKDHIWYNIDNNELIKMGSQVDGKYLLDRSRRSVYTRLFFQCNAPVLYVRPLDKRIGSMRTGYLGKLWKTPTMFALPESGRLHYVLPKSEYQNLFADEIPFYWENTAALLINPFQLYSRREMPLRFVMLPGSTENDNRRRVDMQVIIDPESNSALIEMRVKLSGQFSTMMRPAYEGELIDSNVFGDYGSLPLDHKGLKPNVVRKVAGENEFPFTHTYELEYKVKNLFMKGEKENLNLEVLFPVLNSVLTIDNQPFCPDFRLTDEVNILVKLENDESISTTQSVYERRFGRSGFSFSITPQGSNAFLIRSRIILGDSEYVSDNLTQIKEASKVYVAKSRSVIPVVLGNP